MGGEWFEMLREKAKKAQKNEKKQLARDLEPKWQIRVQLALDLEPPVREVFLFRNECPAEEDDLPDDM